MQKSTRFTANEIKKAAHKAVILYEAEPPRLRKATLYERDGYDLISKKKREERHIEVKGTTKNRFTWRYLTENEFQALIKDPKFYLYLVTRVGRKPMIEEMSRNDVLARYLKTEVLHIITFPKKLEAEADEV